MDERTRRTLAFMSARQQFQAARAALQSHRDSTSPFHVSALEMALLLRNEAEGLALNPQALVSEFRVEFSDDATAEMVRVLAAHSQRIMHGAEEASAERLLVTNCLQLLTRHYGNISSRAFRLWSRHMLRPALWRLRVVDQFIDDSCVIEASFPHPEGIDRLIPWEIEDHVATSAAFLFWPLFTLAIAEQQLIRLSSVLATTADKSADVVDIWRASLKSHPANGPPRSMNQDRSGDTPGAEVG